MAVKVMLHEINLVSQVGYERSAVVQKIMRQFAEQFDLPLPSEEPPAPWKRFTSFFTSVIDLGASPGLSTVMLDRPYVSSLFDEPPADLVWNVDSRFFVDFMALPHLMGDDVTADRLHPKVREIMANNAVSPMGALKLNDKLLLQKLSGMGVGNIPATLPVSAISNPAGFMFKPKGSIGGKGFYWEELPPVDLREHYLAQELVKSGETFLFPRDGEWHEEYRVTDLRFYITGKLGAFQEFWGCFSRVGGPGSRVSNLSSGGAVSSLYFVDFEAEWENLWTEKLRQLEPTRVQEYLETQAAEQKLYYDGRLLPICTRPRFLPKSLLNWVNGWAPTLMRALWEVNQSNWQSSIQHPLINAFPWCIDNPHVIIGVDTGIEM